MRKIVTSYSCPPIPVRNFDWCAYYDGEEEAGGYGYGKTEAEAIEDFIQFQKDWHDERLGEAPVPTKPSPVSWYLSLEAAEARLSKLVSRVAAEHVNLGSGGITWLLESDYWKLPKNIQVRICMEASHD